jgi:uncharacterized protein (DUF736 family)
MAKLYAEMFVTPTYSVEMGDGPEDPDLETVAEWLEAQNLPEDFLRLELTDPETGETFTINSVE